MTINETLYNDDLKKYKEYYNKYYLNIEKSYNCVLSNPSSLLQEEINRLKEIFKKIDFSGWKDDVQYIFEQNINACNDEYDYIMNDIKTNFTSIENQYKSCYPELINLKKNYDELEDEISKYPNPSSSSFYNRVIDPTTLQISSKFDNDKFHNACSNWSSRCQDIIKKCEKNKELIDKCIESLNNLNMTEFKEIAILQNPVYKNPKFRDSITMFGQYWNTIAPYNTLEFARRNFKSRLSCYKNAKNAYDYIDKRVGNSEAGILSHIECQTKKDLYEIAYDEVMAGRGSLIQVNGAGEDGQHFVYVAGVRAGADPNNLKDEDFLIMDSDGQCFRQLGTKKSTNEKYIRERNLLTGYDSDLGYDHKYEYRIDIFSEVEDIYLGRARNRKLEYGKDWSENYG